MAAESVDSQLRNTVRAARSRSLRCVKAIIVQKGSALADAAPTAYTLALANSLPEEAGAGIDKEFQRCVKSLLEPDKPSLLLFRADLCENIEGSRWLLLAWLPESAPEVDRARYVRSCGMLADLVQQPYFLNELLVKDAKSLSWVSAARALAQPRPKGPVGELAAAQLSTSAEDFLRAPLRLSQAAQGLLQRLVQKEDSCLKLILSSRLSLSRLGTASGEVSAASTAPVLEAKVMDCQSPAQLAKAELPSTSCFFALYTRDDLVFVHWCPDRLSRDPTARMRDDSRYAVLKPTVQRLVMGAFSTAPRLLLVDAREPQDLVDGANRAADADVAKQADSKNLIPAARGGYLAAEPTWWPSKGLKLSPENSRAASCNTATHKQYQAQ